MSQHVALKCTYNNGDEGPYVGFAGTCTEGIIKRNIENGRVWCSQKDCACRKYYENGFRGKKPVNPCYESQLFRRWEYGAGWYHTGKRAGVPIHLSRAGAGKTAVLTTRFPGEPERDRRIIGFFKMARITNDPGKETMMMAAREFRVRLLLDEARELFFWDYYRTRGGRCWNTGLVRYLSDEQVLRILSDVRETIRDEKAKAAMQDLLRTDFPGFPTDTMSAGRAGTYERRTKRVVAKRKYGAGGEGKEHRRLKEWIARNPAEIGLASVRRVEIEHVFVSGDAADIVFELTRNTYAVVEIETYDPYPGCHQALKYRVLKCAELGIDVTSPNVRAILVAPSIPGAAKDFCREYGIATIEGRPVSRPLHRESVHGGRSLGRRRF